MAVGLWPSTVRGVFKVHDRLQDLCGLKPRLYSNENFSFRVVEQLRRPGCEVLTSRDANRANRRIPDDEVPAFASGGNRAILTFNRLHFIRLHRSTKGEHAGIVVCSVDTRGAALADRIHRAIEDAGELAGKLPRVNLPEK